VKNDDKPITAEQQYIAHQLASETFYQAALDARRRGLDTHGQYHAGVEALIDHFRDFYGDRNAAA
jgi:hypothetical protein